MRPLGDEGDACQSKKRALAAFYLRRYYAVFLLGSRFTETLLLRFLLLAAPRRCARVMLRRRVCVRSATKETLARARNALSQGEISHAYFWVAFVANAPTAFPFGVAFVANAPPAFPFWVAFVANAPTTLSRQAENSCAALWLASHTKKLWRGRCRLVLYCYFCRVFLI